MPSPFPGMDPYIESQGLWEDFHQSLVPEIKRILSDKLPQRHVPRLGERLYVETISEDQDFSAKPDVSVVQDVHQWRSGSAAQEAASEVAVLAEPLILPAAIDEEFREVFLEIREVPTGRIVTVLELLSPRNKRSGCNGRELYLRKRQGYREGRLNLVKIDLLRGGRRPPMGAPWPVSDYYILAARAGKWRAGEVWPFNLSDRVPLVPIPLLPPDPDVIIDIQPLIQNIYVDGRYERLIDYGDSPRPKTSDADAAWLDRLRVEAKLRPAPVK